MSTPCMKALCCTCGSIRECRRPRNHRAENYWLGGTIDNDWHRETGDLKCAECGRITTHALLLPEADNFKDHAERIQRIALGWKDPMGPEVVNRIRERYRQGVDRNPFLCHRYWFKDAEAARASGTPTITAICGDAMKTPKERPEPDDHEWEMSEPEPMRDQEYEDPDTGLWWVDMECPNCLALANAMTLRHFQRTLARRLLSFDIAELDYCTVQKLLGVIDEIASADVDR